MIRSNGRANDELRPVEFTQGYLKHPEGSVLISTGETKVICTATVEEGSPGWLNNLDQGRITAEYGMLPRATNERTNRHRISGRTQEIQRLIGRCLRAAVDMTKLGEYTIRIDCDVIQADGGTRTASITGGFVALAEALEYMVNENLIDQAPILGNVAAVSVGVIEGEVLLDLDYDEDSKAEVDMNIAMRNGQFVEVQGTGEGSVFDRTTLDRMVSFATKGIDELIDKQRAALAR